MESYESIVGKSLSNDIHSLIKMNYEGLIGVESATEYWGLSTFWSNRTILLYEDSTQNYDGYISEFGLCFFFVPDVNTKNIVHITEKLSVTDREQTVCDMVRYNRHEFHLYETIISAYEDGEVDIEKMERLAEEYNILDRLRNLYQTALEEIDFDNE